MFSISNKLHACQPLKYHLIPPTYKNVINIIKKWKHEVLPVLSTSYQSYASNDILFCTFTSMVFWHRSNWEWKKTCTILIHRKSDTKIPSNFRLKYLTSKNLYIMSSQIHVFFLNAWDSKRFYPRYLWNFKHSTQMASIISKSCIKQRSLVITLLDRKNTFNEVHHNLIQSVDSSMITSKILPKAYLQTLRLQSLLQNSTIHLFQLAVESFEVIVSAINSSLYASTLLSNI